MTGYDAELLIAAARLVDKKARAFGVENPKLEILPLKAKGGKFEGAVVCKGPFSDNGELGIIGSAWLQDTACDSFWNSREAA